MTSDQAHSIYLARVDHPHGKAYAATVGRFQEGFLRDKTGDLEEAFALAVEAAERANTIIALKAAIAAGRA